MEEKREYTIGLRMNADEYTALRELAAAEVQTPTNWLRRRLYAEATAAGLLSKPFERARTEPSHEDDH